MHSLLSVFLFAAPMTSDYSDLQAALAKQDFQLADRLTRDHLDRIVNRLPPVENTSFDQFSARHSQIPCQDLATIDQLWRTASRDRFGFTPQARIWNRFQTTSPTERSFLQFAHAIGWLPKIEPNWSVSYRIPEELNYSLTAPIGHLPAVGIWEAVRWDAEVFGVAFLDSASRDKVLGRVYNLMPRVAACQLQS